MEGRMEHLSKYEVMEQMTDDIRGLMEDLYQSGFDTVHETSLRDLQKAAAAAEQFGMKYLAELLGSLSQEILAGRHRMERNTAGMAELYTKVNEYLYLCREKTAYDRGFDYYAEL